MMKVPETIKQMAKLCVSAYNELYNSIEELNKRCEIKNEIASLSSFHFVSAFDHIAGNICVRRITPYTETYVSLGKKAVELLASGVEQADVLDYFDELLEKEKSK